MRAPVPSGKLSGTACRSARAASLGGVLLGVVATLGCVVPPEGGGDGRPDGAPELEATTVRTTVPDWVDEAPARAGGNWTVIGVGHGADDAAAVAAALHDAREQLAEMQSVQLEDTLALARKQLDDAPPVLSERLSFAELRAEAARQLEVAALVGEPYLERFVGEPGVPAVSSAWLRLSISEDELHPDESLRRLISLEGALGLDQRLFEETLRAEGLGRLEWAHLAAALAERTRSESADLLLRLARFHRRSGHPLVAKRLLDRTRVLVSPFSEIDPARQRVEQFALELFDGVPTLAVSGKALRELSAASLREPVLERGSGKLRRPAPTTWYLNLVVKPPARRLLALWIEEGELRRLELPREGAVEGAGPYHLGLALDADFSGALLLVWALPPSGDVWRAADALSGRVLKLGARDGGDEDPRLRLHVLVRALEELADLPDVGALVVQV